MDVLKLIAQESTKTELPGFEISDIVKISINIREGERERIQLSESTVIARRGSDITETFTVKRVFCGVGVERVFPIHFLSVKDVAIMRKGRVRRAKPYYLHDRVGKAAKVKEQIR